MEVSEENRAEGTRTSEENRARTGSPLDFLCSFVTRSPLLSESLEQATFLSVTHFDVICDLLLNRRTTTWTLSVKL